MKNQVVAERENKKEISEVLRGTDRAEGAKMAVHFFLGFMTAVFPEEYRVSPFCPAAVAASGEYAFLTFIGGSFGYVLSRGIASSIRYILLLWTVTVITYLFKRKFRTIRETASEIVIGSASVAAYDIAFAFFGELTWLQGFFILADALLCAGGVYIFKRSTNSFSSGAGLHNMAKLDGICLALSGSAVLLSISGADAAGIRPANVIACLLVLFSANYKGAAGGGIMGIITGSILSLSGNTDLLYMYAPGGMISGLLSPLGQYFQAVAMVAVSGAVSLITDGGSDSFCCVIECAISCIAFTLIPHKWLNGIGDYLDKSGLRTDNEVNMQVALELRTAAAAVDEIKDIVVDVTREMEGITDTERTKIYARIQQRVCVGCERKSDCWNENFYSTVDDIELLARRYTEGESADKPELYSASLSNCPRLQELVYEVESDYSRYIESADYRIKLDQMRSVVTNQFSSMALLLGDVSRRLTVSRSYNENKSRSVKLALAENGLILHSCTCYENETGETVVEVGVYDEPGKTDHLRIARILRQTLGKSFRESAVTVIDFVTLLTFTQRPSFDIVSGFKQIPKGDNRICGDCVEILDDVKGNRIVILSDGMGTGKRAAVDGTMTCSLMHKLMGSGFTFESALRIVNSALLIKSSDESLATVDTVSINTFNGKCDFYKAGAAVSYIRHKDRVTTVMKSSLPVGILEETEFAHTCFELNKGDIILMASDGVGGEDEDWLEDALLAWSTDNMQELAGHIADMARYKNRGEPADDITVVALKITAAPRERRQQNI